MVDSTEDLFDQLVEKMHDIGEVDFESIFVDGMKIEFAANKYTFVWEKEVSKNPGQA